MQVGNFSKLYGGFAQESLQGRAHQCHGHPPGTCSHENGKGREPVLGDARGEGREPDNQGHTAAEVQGLCHQAVARPCHNKQESALLPLQKDVKSHLSIKANKPCRHTAHMCGMALFMKVSGLKSGITIHLHHVPITSSGSTILTFPVIQFGCSFKNSTRCTS